jgi:integrase
VFRHHYRDLGPCSGCGRVLALKERFCRLCWRQAALQATAAGGLPRGSVSVLEAAGEGLACHQLFFDRMKLRRADSPVHANGRRGRPPKPAPAPVGRPLSAGIQLALFRAARDFTRFDEGHHANRANPWLVWGQYLAFRRAESRGWRSGVRMAVQRGLVILLSAHVDGDSVSYCEAFPALRALGIGVERVAEVLEEMGVFVDDRPRSFECWLERKLAGLAPGIRTDVEAWLRTLHDGGPRSNPRRPETAGNYLNVALPSLEGWSTRYGHLREVTAQDVVAAVDSLRGSRRSNTAGALRSLFSSCKKRGTIFRNPAARLKVGQHPYRVIQPLVSGELEEAVAAATTPTARLIVALAAVHAARVGVIRALQLDDVDLGNRRLVVAGRSRPLDELTYQAFVAWLAYRRDRWPNTANPHVIINQRSAVHAGPVSTLWAKKALRGRTATLERLRIDRQLEEALVRGPDPLHLAAVFGMSEKTAIRYAAAAGQLLATPLENSSAPDRA